MSTDEAERDTVTTGLQAVQLACLAWVIWLPVSQPLVLYPALLLVFLTSLVLVVRRGLRPDRRFVLAWGLYLAWVVVVAAVSALRGNPGVVHQTSLWLGLPLLWGTWALSLTGPQVRRTFRTLLAVGSLGSVLVVWLAASGAWDVPGLPGFLASLQDTRVVVAPTDEIEVNYLGLSSLVGTGALAIAAAGLPRREDWLPSRPWLLAAAVLHLVAAAVSGRRGLLLALLLVVGATAVVGLVLLVRDRAGTRSVTSYVGAVLGVAVVVLAFALTSPGANLNSLLNAVTSKAGVTMPGAPVPAASPPAGEVPDDAEPTPEPEDDPLNDLQTVSDEVRGEQFHELVQGWKQSPVVGKGFGATLDSDFVRSDARPWMFETEPLQVLLSTGLMGFAVVALVLLALGRTLLRALRTEEHSRAVLVAAAVLTAVLLACATNPYLQAPGHGWMLFLALGTARAVLGAARPLGQAPDEDDAAARVTAWTRRRG